jgi:hypothetical protein
LGCRSEEKWQGAQTSELRLLSMLTPGPACWPAGPWQFSRVGSNQRIFILSGPVRRDIPPLGDAELFKIVVARAGGTEGTHRVACKAAVGKMATHLIQTPRHHARVLRLGELGEDPACGRVTRGAVERTPGAGGVVVDADTFVGSCRNVDRHRREDAGIGCCCRHFYGILPHNVRDKVHVHHVRRPGIGDDRGIAYRPGDGPACRCHRHDRVIPGITRSRERHRLQDDALALPDIFQACGSLIRIRALVFVGDADNLDLPSRLGNDHPDQSDHQ